MHKLLSLSLLFSRPMHKTFEKTRTLHIVHEHFENVIRWKVALFPKQYWNQNKYFILISIDFNTRMCFFFSFCCFDIPKLKAIAIFRSGVLASKVSSFLLPRTPKRERRRERKIENFVKSKENFDFETKVWDKMPTERETYYLTYLTALIGLKQTKLWKILGAR